MALPAKAFLSFLVENAILNSDDADKYEIAALQKNIPIEDYLLNFTEVPENTLLTAKAKYLNVGFVDIAITPVSPQAVATISESIAKGYHVLPFELDEVANTLKIAMQNPVDLQAIEFLQKRTGKIISPYLVSIKALDEAINNTFNQNLSPDVTKALSEVVPVASKTTSISEASDTYAESPDSLKDAPIAKIVSTILDFAISGRASDIHIEPFTAKTRVRYRIDGILSEKLVLPISLHESLVSRIKILSGLKIDEKRVPQDGRFSYQIKTEEVDLRISTLPTIHGEKVVIRLLKKTGGIPSLNDLGLSGPQLKHLTEASKKPFGIILVTGPTGSGKSTTLYSVLSTLNAPGVNILTLEDPVEYELIGVNQVQINPQAGLTFATGLRSFLRQDPNIILVGEIRDKETTDLSLQAALTGHLVFSTLHTNNAATAIPRLKDLGGESFLIASVLQAVLGQRIIRRLCDNCKVAFTPEKEVSDDILATLFNLLTDEQKNAPSQFKLFKAVGCDRCAGTGYFGRTGIFELMPISPSISHLILTSSTAEDIEKKAIDEGMITMRQDGYLKVLAAITSLEEVLRATEN